MILITRHTLLVFEIVFVIVIVFAFAFVFVIVIVFAFVFVIVIVFVQQGDCVGSGERGLVWRRSVNCWLLCPRSQI